MIRRSGLPDLVPVLAKAAGVSFEDFIRSCAANRLYPLAPDEIEAWIADRLRKHREPGPSFEHRSSDGRWLQVSEQRASDGGVVGIRTDVTRLKQQEQALRDSEERFRRVVEASPSALVMIDQTGRNTVKFTERGDINVDLKLEAAAADRAAIRVVVRDTGIGIAPEIRGRLFEEFFQGDAGRWRRYGGSGLGLAICRRLVALMGGSIGADSRPGEGSCFWFTAEFARGEEKRRVETPAGRTQPRPARILLVDDLKINRDLGAGLLASAGHQVDCVDDGSAALAAVAAKDYQVVPMDVQMPKMDGMEATTRIRTLPEPKCHVPIVAMTAYATKSDVQSCLTVGMDDHLAKPVEKQRLLDVVDRWAWQQGRTEHGSTDTTEKPTPPAPDEPLNSEVIATVEQSLGRAETVRIATTLIERLRTATHNMRRQAQRSDIVSLQKDHTSSFPRPATWG